MASTRLDINKLSTAEKLALIEEIWESLCETPDALTLSNEDEVRLDQRLDEMDLGKVEGRPWEEIRAGFRARRT